MTGLAQIRSTFLDFFKKQGHEVVASSPLVPRNDPTLMFANSGMVQFKNVFTGVEKRPYSRATTAQKCVRAGGKHNDLDNVGYTARHHTFFEMLGNFSFGDYFKPDAIEWAWTLVTREYGLPKDKLTATVYSEDDEAFQLWKKIAGLPDSRIIRIPTSDNFWRMGDTVPAARARKSSSTTATRSRRPARKPRCRRRPLHRDLEPRVHAVRGTAGRHAHQPAQALDRHRHGSRAHRRRAAGHPRQLRDGPVPRPDCRHHRHHQRAGGRAHKASNRVIADHLRASSFLIADGVLPSNEGRGYVLRRIMRRAMRHAELLGVKEPLMWKLVPALVREMGAPIPNWCAPRT